MNSSSVIMTCPTRWMNSKRSKKEVEMKTKICKYCGKEFSEIDFPRSFERMITCSKIECMKIRRQENQGIVKKNLI